MSKSPHPVIDRGFITVPEKPGIGVELNKQVIEKHITRGKDFFS
jgi:L-alanine-DL-glutamate epimerase-like enolase superfamily enzyme